MFRFYECSSIEQQNFCPRMAHLSFYAASFDHIPDSINELHAIVLKPCPQIPSFSHKLIARSALLTVFSNALAFRLWSPDKD